MIAAGAAEIAVAIEEAVVAAADLAAVDPVAAGSEADLLEVDSQAEVFPVVDRPMVAVDFAVDLPEVVVVFVAGRAVRAAFRQLICFVVLTKTATA